MKDFLPSRRIVESLTPSIFDELDKIMNNLGKSIFPESWPLKDIAGNKFPKVNIRKNKEKTAWIIEASVPFTDKKDIDINIKNNILSISAKAHQDNSTKDNDYFLREIRRSSFYRSWQIDNMDANKVEATMKDGILTIKVPFLKPEEKDESISVQIK